MTVKISNIREINDTEKRKLFGVKYRITLTVLCKKHHKRFDIEYIPKKTKQTTVECPLCKAPLTLAAGNDINKRLINLPPSLLYSTSAHVFESETKEEVGLYNP